MALRALDNALPAAVADQRPKKAAKLLSTAPTVAVARSPTGSGADRGVRPVRGPAARPRPQSPAAGLVAGLDSRDWVMVCEALLAPILEKVVLGILKTVKNPRSAVLKTFVMACTDVIAAFGNLWLSSSCSSSLSKPMRAMATSMPPCRCTDSRVEPEPPLEHGSAVQEVELRMDHDLVVVGAWTIKLAGEMDGLGNGGAREILGLTNPRGARSSLGVA
ncbi:uncharacterized protein [Aegilops tauschii subsp. strangulata]|uniref:uncharacterized protein isoform X2 n=1 Tax=Aegilops tauschii subsp. strangulata TaxID=200361 RepID=UPI001ABC81AE|nr:uncharacterized protein LOC109736248 isoform X3 [Aegilops tauschii subsp. strangulata]